MARPANKKKRTHSGNFIDTMAITPNAPADTAAQAGQRLRPCRLAEEKKPDYAKSVSSKIFIRLGRNRQHGWAIGPRRSDRGLLVQRLGGAFAECLAVFYRESPQFREAKSG